MAPLCHHFLLTLFSCSTMTQPQAAVPARVWVPLHGLQLLPGVRSRVGVSNGCGFLQGTSTCSGVGSFTACSVHIYSGLVLSMGHSTTTCFTAIFCTGCREMSAPASGEPLSHLGACRVFLIFFFFPSFLKYTFPEAPPCWLRGSAVLCGGVVGAGWNHMGPAWGSPGLSTQRSPCSHPYQHLVTGTQHTSQGEGPG